MKLKVLALLVFGLAVPALCSAQSVKAGAWTGSVTPPGEQDAMPVTFDVTVHGDSLGIVLHAGEHGDFTMTNAKHADGKISFTFNPGGPTVTCTLSKTEAGEFSGPCIGDDGSTASMTMVPPKEG
jgi:hypothetical protein